jgi:hypothetical protein
MSSGKHPKRRSVIPRKTIMRQAIGAFVAFVVAAAFLADAVAGPNAADAQKIDACLKAAVEKAASGVVCIGIVADPCIATASKTDSYIKDSAACAARELAIWTTRLQRAVQSASKGGGKATATAVAASQKSFADSLAKLCPQFENLDPGMSLGGPAYCRLHETAMRVLVLERLAAAVNPH